MGERVRIADLARRMIRLAGLAEGQDIQIDIVGLRPGEKLHEELMSGQESLLPTHHPKFCGRPARSGPGGGPPDWTAAWAPIGTKRRSGTPSAHTSQYTPNSTPTSDLQATS